MSQFPHLLSEIEIGSCTIKNRIVSTGHHTYLADVEPGDPLIAYHEARAKGGAGLIVSEIIAVHETASFSKDLLCASDRASIPAFSKLAETCQRHGAKVFGQLFHPGREILSATGGMLPVAYAPSTVPNERFHIMPKEMSEALIGDIVSGFALNAAHLAEAGYDGVEIVASHGYLPAQFLNPRVNLRDDAYGGDAERRLQFVREVAAAVRAAAGDLVLGLRISGAELDDTGLTQDEVSAACEGLADAFDYFSVVAGTSATLGGSVHIVPPMGLQPGYVAPFAASVRKATGKPVIATGRINQPQVAEQIIASGDADLCGMTRALICDPQMPAKAAGGKLDDIRACIGCNQACIGRAHKGLGISCIQYPESGRELEFSGHLPAPSAKKVVVVGGGPGGMKAAAVAASRGHKVTLLEKSNQLGGQARLAQLLPGREEFGGIITNLCRELEVSGAEIQTGVADAASAAVTVKPDAIVLATGAKPYVPALDGLDSAHCVTAWQVLQNEVNPGSRVVIADWRSDWIGIGLAERLALAGSAVTLCVNAAMAGEAIQLYARNHYVGRLHKLGVNIRTHMRLFGADEDTTYFQDTLTGDPVLVENTDTLVLSLGHVGDEKLHKAFDGLAERVMPIGDCVAARTAEEAVYEGMLAGRNL
ncbi:MAG: FAD-dependent oxidoreductase [Alphaproteobacteria bacterium]|nr:FAD-dependent oxidoreductase [Alphaproteobacteria bacterium]